MFDKFGEFGSSEELNRAAEGLREEGDLDSLRALAEENGIDIEDANDYATLETDMFSTPYTAAMGRRQAPADARPTPDHPRHRRS